ncbi:PML-RARA-regulated adapter molecule 1 isoform X2 [Octodon degus]|uniref:PML-RARA-regulated adapter molecule 1 n=1 Tax=Octodon degus TaxID=10160 RepID=A0A6P6DLE1_OCTDE|nr:PML-RARA-regulated adapter molecule 1 isoform X2 [Octodon degus]
MDSQSDFRSLQAKFQASLPEPSNLPKKPPKPEANRLLKKLPQHEPSAQPKQPPQPQPASLPKKLPQPEFASFSPKPSKSEFSDLSKKHPQPEATLFPRKPLKPEATQASQSASQRDLQPPSEPKPSAFPKKPPQPEFSAYPRKPPQLQVSSLPGKSPPQPECSEVSQVSPSKVGPSYPHPCSPKPEFSVYPRKPLKPQARTSKKSLPQPELSEVPTKPEPEPWAPHTLKPGSGAFPKKAVKPEFGGLTRTSSEPEVSVLPKRPRQPEFKPLCKKPPPPEPVVLPRTCSEPEFSSLPRKFSQPENRRPPHKMAQPEAQPLPKKHPHSKLFQGLPIKNPLPGSVSESSLPTALVGTSELGVAAGPPHWKSEEFKGYQPPPRKPLPPTSSLGPPPAKPPLPPGPLDVQSFRRGWAAATGMRRAHSSAGTHFQALRAGQLQNPDEIYEMYDQVEPDSSPGPRGKEVPPTQQATSKLPADSDLRGIRKTAPLPQQVPSMDPKVLKQLRKAEKAEREFRKKFKFEGEIVIHTRMMIDPNAKTRRGGGKHLGIRRGEILEVIEYTSKDEMLCRDPKGKYGYVPRTALLPLETEVYDDVGFCDPLENQAFPREQ